MLYLSLENIIIRQISVLHTMSQSMEKKGAFRKSFVMKKLGLSGRN